MSTKTRSKRPRRQAPSLAEARHLEVLQEENATDRLLRAILNRSSQVDDVTECMTGQRVWGSYRQMPDCSACYMAETCDGAECRLFDYALKAHHRQPNHFDHWELRYFAANPARTSIPSGAYRSDKAAHYCASDKATCGLDCAGCKVPPSAYEQKRCAEYCDIDAT